jgi:hypothetical protein
LLAEPTGEHSLDRLSQSGEVVLDDPPNDARVNAVMSMTQYVPEASDALPRLIRRKHFSLIPNLRAASLIISRACKTA